MKLILNNGNIIECSVQEYSELIGKGLVNSSNSSCGNSSNTLVPANDPDKYKGTALF